MRRSPRRTWVSLREPPAALAHRLKRSPGRRRGALSFPPRIGPRVEGRETSVAAHSIFVRLVGLAGCCEQTDRKIRPARRRSRAEGEGGLWRGKLGCSQRGG